MSGSWDMILPDDQIGKGDAPLARIEDKDITPLILAGGQGTRLRPLTSDARPKSFLRVGSDYSLFQETLLRAAPFGAPVIVGHERDNNRFMRECKDLRRRPLAIIGEPVGRSTAASVALGAICCAYHARSVMVIMPSDHYIEKEEAFQEAVRSAVHNLGHHDVCSIGVRPHAPLTRYGYIQVDDVQGDFAKTKSFVEKPDKTKAQEFVDSGYSFWNTGIFAVRPQKYLSMLQLHEPDIFNAAQRAYEGRHFDDNAQYESFSVAHDPYMHAPPIPVDKAIMEKSRNAAFVLMRGTWDDLGCWPNYIKMLVLRLLGKLPAPRLGTY